MTLTTRAKIGLAFATIVAAAVYLVIVDYGVNAGRIHHGVNVAGIDLGGLTQEEAVEVLEEHEARLERAPVLVTRQGVTCHFEPHELAWDGRPFVTSVAAYRIGRGDSWFAALGTRFKAWVTGVRISWLDQLDRKALSRLLDDCERIASPLGYDVRRYELRQRIRDAIVTWPRYPVTVPIES